MKVFLSSTAQDLDAYRKVADDTILRLSQESIVMERFGPRPGTPIEECERMARESDVVVCIVAHRYGSIAEGRGTSFTQLEIEAAHKARKKVLAWIVDDDYRWSEKQEQDLFLDPTVFGNNEREAEVRERIRKLVEFKAWLRKTVISESFTTAEDLGRKIAIALPQHIPRKPDQPVPQDKISIARLPTTSSSLFGREAELKILDNAWTDPNTNIVSFVAWGGVGKTALVNHWLKQHMARDNYRNADRVVGWSFFSQGTRDPAASADLFIDWALRWFGDPDPTAGSPWDKGERLAGHIRQSRMLLILDGLEPLQYPPGPQEGRLKDAAMQALLIELAAHQPGLCVISTRELIGDLVDFEDGIVIQHNLEQLSPRAGAQILRSLNVKGDDAEVELASKELGGHAFSLTLLGSYLDEVYEGDVRRRVEIENLFDDTRFGAAAEKMITAYEKWLGEGIELAILRLLGMFDRPADIASIEALRQPPVIVGLNEPLQHFKGREWNQALGKLRRIRLLAGVSEGEPGTLDAHPLVREYFKQQWKRERPDAWRNANIRLYEHLKKTTKEFPDSVEEMSPLYSAVAHGCAGGKHVEALHDVYFHRIQRGEVYFNLAELGAFGADLGVLSAFFDIPWTQLSPNLEGGVRAFILSQVGTNLRALGRGEDSLEALEAALRVYIEKETWKPAANAASNLCQTYMMIGNLPMALNTAKQNIEFANRTVSAGQQAISLVMLANAYHQLGDKDESTEAFRLAEERQQAISSAMASSILQGVKGYGYCELLLEQGKFDEAKRRAVENVKLADETPLNVGFNELSLALVWLIEGDLKRAEHHLNNAVKALRHAGHMELLPGGLLLRAKLYRLTGNYDLAGRQLDEVSRMARRGGMRLHLADYHLESARLRLVSEQIEEARKHFATAKEMIDRMGYHRRDKEVAELEAQLA